ncbi:hypothetical protein PVAND_014558 [Polypedilum vanderplanki]|uniref:Metalloendopeptidase n=1 Tax=Polypedilum vanderplanki TaxID=319348 RepID=A0A9J6BAJ5_POLVA|nr:hypothetical protein PVAND_014558 [Polypedilum vanderplanki]
MNCKTLILLLFFNLLITITAQSPIKNNRNKNNYELNNDEEVEKESDEEDENIESSDEEDSNESDDSEDENDDGLYPNPKNINDFKRNDEEEYEDFYDEEISDDSDENDDEGGTGILDRKRYWPKTGDFVIIPYTIDSEAGISDERIKRIEAGLKRIARRTCIRFKKAKGRERNFIEFTSTDKNTCSSPVGMNPNEPNQIKLFVDRPGCYKIGTIMHETIHSLGFGHMQAHTNRGKYVQILYENIEEPKHKNYRTYSSDHRTSFDTKYDFFSIMHYGPGPLEAPRMRPLKKYSYYADFMGQRNRMSDGDVERINKMYKCHKKYKKNAPDDYNDVDTFENESDEVNDTEEEVDDGSDEDF